MIDADLDFNGTVLRPCLMASFSPRLDSLVLKTEFTEFDEQKEAEAWGKQDAVFGALEKSFEIRGHKFRTGDKITIADFQLYCEILDVDYMSIREKMDGYRKIKAWMEECSKAAGIKEVHEPWAAEGGPVTRFVGILK